MSFITVVNVVKNATDVMSLKMIVINNINDINNKNVSNLARIPEIVSLNVIHFVANGHKPTSCEEHASRNLQYKDVNTRTIECL